MTIRPVPGAAALAVLVLVLGAPDAPADSDAAWGKLDAEIERCTTKHDYDGDDAATLGDNELGASERAWRECVYAGIRKIVIPHSRVPDAYRRFIAQDKVMTNKVERGDMTRAERRAQNEAFVAKLEAAEAAAPAAAAAGDAQAKELEGMRDELRARQAELQRMRRIQSMSQF